MRSILVIGGGIAGVESALTLARGLPSDQVTLVTRWPALRVSPDLVHVPFGVSVHRADVDLVQAMALRDVHVIVGSCDEVDLDRGIAQVNGSEVPFDIVVAAPGVDEALGSAHSLRTGDGALALRADIEAFVARAEAGRPGRLVVRVQDGETWAPPAAEFALLARTWFDRVAPDAAVTLACAGARPLDLLGDEAAIMVERMLGDAGVELLTDMPGERVDEITGDVTVELRPLAARRIHGLPPLTADGFHPTDGDGRVAPGAFVVGDASSSPWKAGFATAWQARRVLTALGGDIEVLGRDIDGVPSNCFEYQLDAGERTLVVRARCSGHLDAPFLDARVLCHVTDAPARKLQGTLLRRALVVETPADAASVEFRKLLHMHDQARRNVG
jgi:NADPH-dependent 2,4-dienoyl-CoA reductase/sulfur reductase-like enzyme